MLCSVRIAARVLRSPRLSASFVVALGLVTLACTDQAPPHHVIADSSSGAPEQPGRPEAGAPEGGLGGQPGDSSSPDAGKPTSADAAGASASDQGPSPPDSGPVVDDPNDDPPVDNPPDDDPPGDDDPPVDNPPVDDPRALPCDVQKLLSTRCQGCHSSTPSGGASVSLLTYADLTAPSKNEATITVAARSLQRMKDSLSPMPPAPASPATTAEIATLWGWLDQGLPVGKCDSNPGSNPYDASPTCSSGGYWTAYDSGTPWMNPGLPCIKCHRQNSNFAPVFTVAGTVFPTAHEPDKCFGVTATTGAQVIITDANGQELSPLPVVSGGNFGAILSGLALPYRAKVVVGESERVMLTPQTNGDCNLCHTQAGSQGALGRIIVP
jgi:hypothetical protein